LVTDNGPQFVNCELEELKLAWEFKHVTSSPSHHKWNGYVKAVIKVAKKVFKKDDSDNQGLWLALMDYRNTPTTGVQGGPVQQLMSRQTKTLISTTSKLSQPESQKRQVAKCYHDRKAMELPELGSIIHYSASEPP